MSFGQAVASWPRNYANFDGRPSRSAYFWVLLLNVVITGLAAAANHPAGNHFSMSPTGLVWPR